MKKSIPLLCLLAIAACTNPNTLRVTATPIATEPRETFDAKNIVASRTAVPDDARFDDFQAYALSNGDRVYCGQMTSITANGGSTGYQPFYIRRSGKTVKSVHYTADSAKFAEDKCGDARRGALRISPH